MPEDVSDLNEQTDDTVLLAFIKNDSQAAYRILVDRYLGKLWRLGVNVLGNESEAEEVVQEALLAVWKNRKKWEDNGSAKFSTWVYRITLNRCIDLKRRRRPTTNTEVIEQTMVCDSDIAADHSLIIDEQNKALVSLMDSLPDKQKKALVLYYFEELSIQEISMSLSTTEQGTRSLLKRGRMGLRKLIGHTAGRKLIACQ
ncbi:MAG: RNA polymerase sigma factor [Alphaproteobacteria bacterium]